ncbi:hypothetical protein ABW19_dt0204776 [Dactylella cylindrospora]|nr:hypothetical protein ABW19_dt0204776 [Dactylella cylindrospora]
MPDGYEQEPIDQIYPSILGEDKQKYPSLVVAGAANVYGEAAVIEYELPWVDIYAPATYILGAEAGPRRTTLKTGAFASASIVAGALAVLMSAYQINTEQARKKLSELATSWPIMYDFGAGATWRNKPPMVYLGMDRWIAPEGIERPVVYIEMKTGEFHCKLEMVPEEVGPERVNPEVVEYSESEYSQDDSDDAPQQIHINFKREATTSVEGGTTTIRKTVCGTGAASTWTSWPKKSGSRATKTAKGIPAKSAALPTGTASETQAELLMRPYVYNATFCKLCIETDGKSALDGIIWIPQDCPCLPEDR